MMSFAFSSIFRPVLRKLCSRLGHALYMFKALSKRFCFQLLIILSVSVSLSVSGRALHRTELERLDGPDSMCTSSI